jgi:DHA2 family multidrug resistance protein
MLCGFAHDLSSMIVFRAAQGFTGGVLIPMCFTIILTTLPKSKQPIGMALFSITATFAPSIGPAVGGYITDMLSWQYIFFLNLIPGVVLVGLLLYSLPASKMNLDLLKKNDLLGIGFMSIGLSSLIYVLEEGQRKDWLGSPLIANAAILAAVFLTLFVVREFFAKYPLVNLRLLGRRNFGFGSIVNVGLGAAMYGSVYLVPVYLATTQGYSAAQIGQVMMWSGLPQLFITPFVPWLMKRIDPRWMLAFGLFMFALSCFLNTSMSHDYAGPQMTLAMVVRALGQPLVMTPLSAMTTAGVEPEQAGNASALFNMMRNIGGSIGTAVASTLLVQREQFHSERIGEHITMSDAAVRDFLAQGAAAMHHAGASMWTAKEQALQVLAHQVQTQAYEMAFNDTFLAVALMLLGAMALVALLRRPTGEMHLAAE